MRTSIRSPLTAKRLFYVSFFAALMIHHCSVNGPSDKHVGGETLNEKIAYLPDGKTPAAFAKVIISNDSEIVSQSYTTDKGLFYIPSLKKANWYSVYIVKDTGGETFSAIQDSVYISSDTNSVQNDTLDISGKITGIIKLQPQHQRMLPYVMIEIKGTSLEATPDTTGKFELNNVPINTRYYLRFTPPAGLNYAPMPLMELKYDTRAVYDLDTISFYNSNIPVVENLTISYDSNYGVVNLNWDQTSYSEVLEYVVIREYLDNNFRSIDSLRGSKLPFFADTIFSNSPKPSQLSISDTLSYKYRYSVVIKNTNRITGVENVDPADTIRVFSPLKTRASFNFTVIDSGSNMEARIVPVNKTVALIAYIKNPVAFTKLEIRGENGFHRTINIDKPVHEYVDTLYWSDSTVGIKHFQYTVKSEETFRSFDTATCALELNKINLIIDKVVLLSPALNGQPFSLQLTIKNTGDSEVTADSDVNVMWSFDNTGLIEQNYTIKTLKPNESFTCILDSAQIKDAGWITSSGVHEIKISVNKNKNIKESRDTDNELVYQIYFSDIDLVIDSVELYPADVIPGNSFSYRAWIVNKGTTPSDSTVPIRVTFTFDDSSSNQSIIYRQINPGDSVMISSTVRKAKEGENKVNIKIESNHFEKMMILPIPKVNKAGNFESNVKNNSHSKSHILQIPEYVDLAIKSFTVDKMSRDSGISLSAEISNDGNVAIIENKIKYKFSINDEWETEFNSIFQSLLLPGESMYIYPSFGNASIRNFLSKDQSIIYNIKIEIDVLDSINEPNKNNNSVSTNYALNEIYINGDFEDNILLDDDIPDTVRAWYPRWSLDKSLAVFKWEDGAGINGSKCISIENLDCNDAHWTFNLKNVIQPGKKYRLSGWVRGKNIDTCQIPFGANLCIDNWGSDRKSVV